MHEITGESINNDSPCFDNWAKKVLKMLKGTVKDSTYALTYKNSIENHLIPYFGKRKLNDIKPIHVQEYFNEKGERLAQETLMKHKMALNRIFDAAIENDVCIKSPISNKIVLNSKIEYNEKAVYTKEQADLILEYSKTHRFGLAIYLMLEYGLSRSEVLGLKWEDVDYDKLTLSINRAVTDVTDADSNENHAIVGSTKNIHRKRIIPISQETAELIKAAPTKVVVGRNKKRGVSGKECDSEYIIHNKNGSFCSPRTWNRRQYDVFMREMHEYYVSKEPPTDIPFLTPHSLRHTRATLWVNEGKSLYAIAKVLGHTDLEMLSKRYGHSQTDDIRNLLGIK